MGITSVQVISVPVADQERARAWYESAFGFKVVADAAMGDSMRWLQLGIPDTSFTITLVTWFDQMPPGSMQGLVLEVDDIDTLAKDLADRGIIEDSTVDEQEWGRHKMLQDLDGNSIVLNQPPR